MRRNLLGPLAALMALCVWSGVAQGQEVSEEQYHKNIRVLQPKPFLETQRVEVVPFAALCVNPGMMEYYGLGGQVSYHFNEVIFAGLQFTQYVSQATGVKTELEEGFELFPERSELGWGAAVRFAWTPMFAKSALLGMFMVHWDAYVYGGGGVTRTRLSDWAPTGEVGVGARLFITRGLALVLEASDVMYLENYSFAGDEESGLMQSLFVRGGLSLFFPYNFSYGYEQ